MASPRSDRPSFTGVPDSFGAYISLYQGTNNGVLRLLCAGEALGQVFFEGVILCSVESGGCTWRCTLASFFCECVSGPFFGRITGFHMRSFGSQHAEPAPSYKPLHPRPGPFRRLPIPKQPKRLNYSGPLFFVRRQGGCL